MLKDKKLAVLGAGKLGETLIKGLLEAGVIDVHNVTVTAAHHPRLKQLKEKFNVKGTLSNQGAIADAEIASEVYSTAGDFDLLVKFYVEDSTDIGHFVNEKVQVIPGIQDTRTIITFKAFG